MTIYETMMKQADVLYPAMRERRRDFHRYAESGWLEIRTGSLVAQRLTELGYEVLTGPDVCLAEERMGLPGQSVLDAQYARALSQGAVQPWAERARDGFTGVIGILRCGDGPVIAMRFDMDALGVKESLEDTHRPAAEGFASVNPGMMHACGHDGHTAIGLAVAEILAELRSQLKGTVKLIFQPAEEGVRGARAIAAHGHLDDADYLLANHMGASCGNWQVCAFRDGTLATTKLDAVLHGKAAHAAMVPEQGSNAMLAAAAAVLNLHAIPRCSLGDTRVNVGTLHAGTGRNVVCDEAVLELEVRGSTTEANAYMERYAIDILEAAARMHGCSCEIRRMGAAESLVSSPEMMELCSAVCREKLGIAMEPPAFGASGSEDCSYLMNRVLSHGGRGIFFHTLTPCSDVFHGTAFDFDESAMPTAVKVFCGMAFALMDI